MPKASKERIAARSAHAYAKRWVCELCGKAPRSYGRLCGDCISVGRLLLDIWRNAAQANVLTEYKTAMQQPQRRQQVQQAKGDGIWTY